MRKASPFAISLEKTCQERGLRLTEQRKVIVRLSKQFLIQNFTQMWMRFIIEQQR